MYDLHAQCQCRVAYMYSDELTTRELDQKWTQPPIHHARLDKVISCLWPTAGWWDAARRW